MATASTSTARVESSLVFVAVVQEKTASSESSDVSYAVNAARDVATALVTLFVRFVPPFLSFVPYLPSIFLQVARARCAANA